jgi:peptide-methionine (S)-S-oxide reductase
MPAMSPLIHSLSRYAKRFRIPLGLLTVLAVSLAAFEFMPGNASVHGNFPAPDPEVTRADALTPTDGAELATFGSGCFWCTEAVFQQLKGVEKVVSGYSGGNVPNPTYQQVCSGRTGHAEVIQVLFDPKVVTYPELLEVFWRTHDPTTRDRQGNDVGSQYRSVIFTHSDRQRESAERYRRKLDEAHVFSKPIVTDIVPFSTFYPAELYHQNYYADHSRQPYCQAVIGPKLDKLRAVFQDKLKP